ncbi:class I SAM-dependent methyltransferase [Paenibacillus qinlingensis]|uniref:SAM-dependent methyltransferase n=1 Tax=Paenibacillus qinlingensis TaxID=1837343 RepID=A0ABU1P4I2_9BACL|nr:class I SAM-dependent methyltransferase [Paenibacillus qinlingensis]MDR6554655.1 SAM-dependent methyltransferase [Paenibacillus qinlingensis]
MTKTNQSSHPLLDSRFITNSDPSVPHFIYPLPTTWWSRPYEYAWCSSFANPTDTVLDAACGISHPFKFYLARHCRDTYACDLDPAIATFDSILNEIKTDIGEDAAEQIAAEFRINHSFIQASITSLPYEENKFDTIFCISVLEHLHPTDAIAALLEFNRTLKDNGRLVLTLDYPTVNLRYFQELVDTTGFEFCGSVDYEQPTDALNTDLWGGLYCFRALLQKKS